MADEAPDNGLTEASTEKYEEDYDEVFRSESESDGPPPRVHDEDKTPVTIVTGFLGAGKTTLVNYILKEQREMKIAVIENEYGAISIDTALVEENVREAEDIVTMDNGCVCCTVRGDLVKALLNFLDRRDTFDTILIETTGIADPSPILATFSQDLDVEANYRVDSVLCLVDAKNIRKQLQRIPTEGAVNEAVQQLAFADTVVVNKTDLVNEEELKGVTEKIKSVNAFARIVQSQKSRVPLDSILNLKSFNLERTLALLDQEAKEAEVRQKKVEEEKKAGAAEGGADCKQDHDHRHKHEHAEKNGHGEGHENGHKHGEHKCGEGCTHEHGEKRKRDGEEGGDGTPALKKAKETVAVSATRHDSQVGSLAVTLQGSLDVDRFNRFMAVFLQENSSNLFRSKGVLSFVGLDAKFVFQGVHEQINCEPSNSNWKEDGSDRESKIVFIGLKLDKDLITAGVKSCLAT